MFLLRHFPRESGKSKFTEIGNIAPGVFTPVLAKHTKCFNLVDTLSVVACVYPLLVCGVICTDL